MESAADPVGVFGPEMSLITGFGALLPEVPTRIAASVLFRLRLVGDHILVVGHQVVFRSEMWVRQS